MSTTPRQVSLWPPAASTSTSTSASSLLHERFPPLNGYLMDTHERLRALFGAHMGAPTSVLFVMGNESADLDSIVSAVTLAYYLSVTAAQRHSDSDDALYAPLVDCSRQDLRLRADVLYAFHSVGVDPETLVFISDLVVPLVKIEAACSCSLSLVLVDHNRLSVRHAALQQNVCGIIDHHYNENMFAHLKQDNVVIEKSGSCTALVAECIDRHTPDFFRSSLHCLPLTRLITDTILIDTHNLNEEQKKTTDHDLLVLDLLLRSGRWLQFSELKRRRGDVSGLSTNDLLRKDTKFYESVHRSGRWVVQISTVPESFDSWLQRCPRLMDEIIACTHNVHAVIVLTSFIDPRTKLHRRQMLLIVSPWLMAQDKDLSAGSVAYVRVFEELRRGLERDATLRLLKVDNPDMRSQKPNVLHQQYELQNLAAGRKQVAPRVEELLSKL